MPSCFSLTKKGDDKASNLSDVDEEICRKFGVKSDQSKYAWDWYDAIGVRLAMSLSLKEIHGIFTKESVECKEEGLMASHEFYESLVNVTQFLIENYVSNAWYERK